MTAAPIDRDLELVALDRALGAAESGLGTLLTIQGPAGIGKSCLLSHLRRIGAARGFTVGWARAAPLDRVHAHGVLRGLRSSITPGGASGETAPPIDGTVAQAFASELRAHAARRPLLLLIDDLHWADAASLRCLAELGRQLDGLPVLIAATLRVGEPGARADLVAELTTGPYAEVLEPGPLGDRGVDAIFHEVLGHPCDAGFVTAAQNVTGGNPLLLRVLAHEASALGLAGTAVEGQTLAALAAKGVGAMVQGRLAGLDPAYAGVALTAAVAGERAPVDDLSVLGELPPLWVRRALDHLGSAGIVESDGWTFVHPLIEQAVLAAAAPASVSRLHRLAAQLRRGRGAGAAEVALHRFAAEPAADPDAVDDLAAAAAAAVAEGAPDIAAALLHRALLEPPAPHQLAAVTAQLANLARDGRPGDEHPRPSGAVSTTPRAGAPEPRVRP